MGFLLDTTAVSEYRRRRSNSGFVAWTAANAMQEAFIGAPTLGELVQGIHKLGPSAERESLQKWVSEIEERFESHILAFDAEAARVWGAASGQARRQGRLLPYIDSLLVAIAVVHDLTIVTRNVRDFEIPEFERLNVISPWT